ncbi:sodium-coupled neutral amino acid transporter 4-like [Pantherophis guttatus]|uniref:Sodium-coupled neutral amino acid transporter 4 n=1 Tax=Pantherophis guttatus TaxID=94885 RepID=A0A6P9AQI5_PANGU|nr:sodium-coupled neutral amino acid transporter 4 [Pantherophis guttatus]XP_034259691.1 sodium-coupled neutral amino acid transporter 4 [Pantherophis guttatus]XP_034259692.1 sodium-coupled neutral amino acid transporter 4 [Pantherophis guttatus]XP_034259693.1 sodium-coupled neutral amino acid transporter 4 [Pantherophis guttatus]XP_060546080.1 sodium-coupled neutral amino acid transporter 4-like [Pantherophis guttatus]XP_060546096.1 sodium-coupled neutral amino acid transporter 4-like [Panthe
MDRLELQKVNTELDEESNSGDSTEDNDADMVDPEKATISSHFVGDDAESQKFLANGFLGKKKMESYTDEYHPGNISFGISAFNLSNAIMGSGILGLSYAMANTGIVLFIILLFSVALMSLYSVHLLLKTAKEGGSLIYEKLGEKAFGWPGKIGAFVSLTMQNIGAMSSYLFIIKYELPEVIRAFLGLEDNSGEWYLNGNYLVIFVSIGIILPLSLLKNLGYLGYTSGFSLTCMVFFVSVVIYKKSQIACPLPVLDNNVGNWSYNDTAVPLHVVVLPNDSANLELNLMMDSTNKQYSSVFEETKTKLHQSGVEYEAHGEDNDKCQAKYFVFNSRTAYTIPILAFAFVCHPEVLPIYSELKNRSRKRMQNVSNVSIMGMLIMYLLAALFGYLTFYGEVEDELLHTYRKVYTFDTLLLMVRLAVLVAVTLTVPIVLFPIRTSLTTLLFPRRPFSWIRHFLIAIVILIFNNLLVIFVPTIKDIFGFIGASAATMLIFILPAAFYLRIVKKEPLRSPQKIGALIFLIVGIIFMFGSMTLILLDWIYNSSHSNQH